MPDIMPIPGQITALFREGTTREEARELITGDVFNLDMIAWMGGQNAVIRVRPGWEQHYIDLLERHHKIVAVARMYQEVP